MVTSGLITFPLFLTEILKMLTVGGCVTAILIALGILFPPVGVLIFIWGAVSTVAKFQRFARRIPLILGGLVLYTLLAVVPRAVRLSSFGADLERQSGWFLVVSMALAGTSLVLVALHVCQTCRYSKPIAAAVMLGCGCYLIMFFITLFLPGADNGDLGDLGETDNGAEFEDG